MTPFLLRVAMAQSPARTVDDVLRVIERCPTMRELVRERDDPEAIRKAMAAVNRSLVPLRRTPSSLILKAMREMDRRFMEDQPEFARYEAFLAAFDPRIAKMGDNDRRRIAVERANDTRDSAVFVTRYLFVAPERAHYDDRTLHTVDTFALSRDGRWIDRMAPFRYVRGRGLELEGRPAIGDGAWMPSSMFQYYTRYPRRTRW